jgi:hypothetical protein
MHKNADKQQKSKKINNAHFVAAKSQDKLCIKPK